MSKKGIELPAKSIVLSLSKTEQGSPGFVKVPQETRNNSGQFAKALASGFLKFSTEGRRLSQTESVQNFIQLAELHNKLTQEAHQFLKDEVPLVYEDQPIFDLLLKFAAWRLSQASRLEHFGHLRQIPPGELEQIQADTRLCQEEYDLLLQSY